MTRCSPDSIAVRGCGGSFCTSQIWHSVRSLKRALESAE
ncbi:hypothetical protein AB9K34_15255 [Sedimentitalea sp. XS_ASV28]